MDRIYEDLKSLGWEMVAYEDCKSSDYIIEIMNIEGKARKAALPWVGKFAGADDLDHDDMVLRAPRPSYPTGTVVLAKTQHGEKVVTCTLIRLPTGNWQILAPELDSISSEECYYSGVLRKEDEAEVLKVIMYPDGATPEEDK